jgi:hypothetical protein
MESILREVAGYVALAIEFAAIVVIAVGTLQVLLGIARVGWRSDDTAMLLQLRRCVPSSPSFSTGKWKRRPSAQR